MEFDSTNEHPTPQEINAAARMLAHNFEITRQQHPDYEMTNYIFCAGVTRPAWEFDEEGNPVRRIEGHWKHTFGWYSIVPWQP